MPVFTYRARDGSGQMVRGRADADTERDLIGRLRNQGLLVLGVEADKDLQVMITQKGSLFSPRIGSAELALFLRQFATMIHAGLPIVTALKVQVRQATNPTLRRVLGEVLHDVEAGESLSVAFGRHGDQFPPVVIHMIAAGEVGGILDDVLNRLATQLEKDELTRQKVKSALVYPTIVSGVAVLVVIFMMVFVVPRFTELYSDLGAELPIMTRFLITASTVAQSSWYIVLALAGLLWFAVKYWRKTESGAFLWDKYWLKVPIFGPLALKQSVARFARTLAGLQASGVTILKALAVAERTVGNRMVAKTILQTLEEVRQGSRLVVPLQRSGLFPPMVIEMTSVGEETGTMEEMLVKVADFYDEEVQRTAERLSGSLEPVVIVFLAGTVGFIVISMMLPIFNLWALIA